VVEAGLDISCDTMHSEVAPVNAIIQRAGRCARFGGEGDVYVYPLAGSASGKVCYLPYDKEICEHSYYLLGKRDNQALDYQAECELVDLVHTEADRRVLAAITAGRKARRELMWRTICWVVDTAQAERNPLVRQLIRKSEALRFILADNPASSLDPDGEDSFSYGRSTLERLLSGAKGQAAMWYYQKSGQPRWWAVADPADLEREGVFALSTRYASYSPRLGLRLRPAGDGNAPSAGMRASPRISRWQPGGSRALYQLWLLNQVRQEG
jgi:CRISPR-associated endonuclease/helicase Cas3